jgi:hypothetical protein
MRNARLTRFKKKLYDDWTKNMYLRMVEDMLTLEYVSYTTCY